MNCGTSVNTDWANRLVTRRASVSLIRGCMRLLSKRPCNSESTDHASGLIASRREFALAALMRIMEAIDQAGRAREQADTAPGRCLYRGDRVCQGYRAAAASDSRSVDTVSVQLR